MTNDDRLTYFPWITGDVSDRVGVVEVRGSVDGGPLRRADLSTVFQQYVFDPQLPADGSADGLHSVQLIARDAKGHESTPFEFAFTLDTQALDAG